MSETPSGFNLFLHASILQAVLLAAGKRDCREYLNAVKFEVGTDKTNLVASDGRRVHIAQTRAGTRERKPFSALIPREVLDGFRRKGWVWIRFGLDGDGALVPDSGSARFLPYVDEKKKDEITCGGYFDDAYHVRVYTRYFDNAGTKQISFSFSPLKYPDWKAIVPKGEPTPKAVPVDFKSLVDVAKAVKLLTVAKYQLVGIAYYWSRDGETGEEKRCAVCRIGGDFFCVLMPTCSIEIERRNFLADRMRVM